MLRGINRQDLFEDEADYQMFIEKLAYYKEKSGYNLYGYCLMSNHIHIILEERKEPISIVIKRISSSYVYYYNYKYARCGHLFQERFKSETVEDESYFVTVLRYVHQNPVRANICKEVKDYKWSSYKEYTYGSRNVETEFALKLFSEDNAVAIKEFIKFNNEENEDKCLEFEINKRLNDIEAKEVIKEVARVTNINELQYLQRDKRNEILKRLKEFEGLSIRQIARITGISYNMVQKL